MRIENLIAEIKKIINDFDKSKPIDFSKLPKLNENYRYFFESGAYTNALSKDKRSHLRAYKILLQEKTKDKWLTLGVFFVPLRATINLPKGVTVYDDCLDNRFLQELSYFEGKHLHFINHYSTEELQVEENAQLEIICKNRLYNPFYIKEEPDIFYVIGVKYTMPIKTVFLKITSSSNGVIFYYPESKKNLNSVTPIDSNTFSIDRIKKNKTSSFSLKSDKPRFQVYKSKTIKIHLSKYAYLYRSIQYSKARGEYEAYKYDDVGRLLHAQKFYIIDFQGIAPGKGYRFDIKAVDYVKGGLQWGVDYDAGYYKRRYYDPYITKSPHKTYVQLYNLSGESWHNNFPVEPLKQRKDLQVPIRGEYKCTIFDLPNYQPPAANMHKNIRYDLSKFRLGLHGIEPTYSNKDYLGIYYRVKSDVNWKLFALYKGVYDKNKKIWSVDVLKPTDASWTVDEIIFHIEKLSSLNNLSDIVDFRSLPKLPKGYRYRLISHEVYIENKSYKSFAHSLIIERHNSINEWEMIRAFHYPIEKKVLIGSTPVLIDPAYTETALDIECSGKTQDIILGYKPIFWLNFNKKTKANFYFLKMPVMARRYKVQGQNREFIFDLSEHPFLAVVENNNSLHFFSDRSERLTIEKNKTRLSEVKHYFISDKVIKLSKEEFASDHKNRIVVDYQKLGLNLEKVEVLKIDFVNEGIVWDRNNKSYDIGYSKKISHSQLTHFYNQRDLLGLFYRKKGENASSSDWKLAALYEGEYQKGKKSGWVITEYRKTP